MSDSKMNDTGVVKDTERFLPSSIPLSGLPARATQVDDSPTDRDDPSLVYRAFTVSGSSASLLRTAATLSAVKDRERMETNLVVERKQAPPQAPITIRYVDIERPLSITHVLLPLPDAEVLKTIDTFLSSGGISSERKHPQSNIYRCHTVVDCNILRFDIRLVPGQAAQGVNVEFRRTLGPAECFSKVYKQFKSSVGSESPRSASPVSPSALSIDEDLEEADEAEIARAIAAMSLWVESDPIEALQCVGQFYLARNRHVTDSAEILAAVCRVIEKSQECTDECSLLLTSVAMACVREFIASAKSVQCCNEVSIEHVSMIAPGVSRAAMCSDLTARREAVGLLLELNPRFSADIKHRVAHVQGFSVESAVCSSQHAVGPA